MSKHTPGPWEVSFSQINAGKHDCIVQFGFNIRENPTAYANARLIAAAPDLLAELEAIAEILSQGQTLDKDFDLPRITAAITKAKGE